MLIELFSVISMALVSLGLFVGKKIPIRFQVCWKTLKDLFFKGLPLMISSGAIIIYAKIDLILIEHFLGVRQVGVYSVATKITEIWYVIPMTVTSLLFPVMLKSKKLSAESYRAKIRLSTEIMILICIFFSMSVFFLLPSVLEASLSGDFRLTSDIVRILAWCGPFVGLGYINGRYMVAENLLYLTLRRNIYGMALNIVLNILLIPRYGLYGAAFSTLFSMMYTGFLCLPFSRKTLDIFMIQCEALSFFIKPRTFFANVKSLREL